MSAYDKFLKSRTSQRSVNNRQIRSAMRDLTPKTAGLVFDLTRGDKGHKVDINRRAHIKAIELVSDLIGSFHLPIRPKLEYYGMVKEATNKNGDITDGVVRIGAVLRTLMGHKTQIDIPVIVRKGSLIEPAVFFFEQAPYVMCGPAMEELVTRGALRKELQPRRMFSPPADGQPIHPDNYQRSPITNQETMFSPGSRNPWTFRRQSSNNSKLDAWRNIDANSNDKKVPSNPKQRDEHVNDWMKMDKTSGKPRQRTNIDTPTEMPVIEDPSVPDAMLDVSERDRDGLFEPGSKVSLEKDMQARERGGGHFIVPSGEEGIVLKDIEGDGKMLYVNFDAMGLTTSVPKYMLKSASVSCEQVQHEVKEMIREGYTNIDIREAITRRFPDLAEEALSGIN